MDKGLISDYIISLTHLYGLVHKNKVAEIYNLQNNDKIDGEAIKVLLKEGLEELGDKFVEIHGDYFVAEAILEFDEFEEQLKQRRGKPFYIPDKEELLKYKEDIYFEITEEYMALKEYVAKNIFNGDDFKSEMLCEDIQGICQYGFSIDDIFEVFKDRNVNFRNEKQVSEVIQLIMDLANNTRLWENNGHTPDEIFNKMEKPNLRILPKGEFPDLLNYSRGQDKGKEKIGRNETCPCGSGKKYKKCCGKD